MSQSELDHYIDKVEREELSRKEIDNLVDVLCAKGHSNHCAIHQVLGYTTCTCAKKGDKDEL